MFGLIAHFFGAESEMARAYMDNVLLSPFAVVGMIMVILSFGGIWVGRKNGKILFAFVTLLGVGSLLAIVAHILHAISIIALAVLCLVLIVTILCWTILLLKKLSLRKKVKDLKVNSKSITYAKKSQQPHKQPQQKQTMGIEKPQDKNHNATQQPKSKTQQENIVQEAPKPETIKSTESIQGRSDYGRLIANRICPDCGNGLKSKQNSYDGSWFKGCSSYPNCEFTVDWRIYKDMERKHN